MHKGSDIYQTVAVSSQASAATNFQVVQMLMHGAVDKLNVAAGFIERINSNDRTTQLLIDKHNVLTKCMEIIAALMAALDFEKGGDIALQLKELYEYAIVNISYANAENNLATILEVRQVIMQISEAWDQIASNA